MTFPEANRQLSPEAALSQLECILVPGNRGFCAGVDHAIEILWSAHMLNRSTKPEATTYCIHPIVHNAVVTDAFKNQGVVFVERFDENKIPPGSMVVFSAHGRPPQEITKAEELGYVVYDAMCPLVLKVHKQVGLYTKRGFTILYLGVKGHREAEGVMGVAPRNTYLIDMKKGANADGALTKLRELKTQGKHYFAVLTQTTLSQHETRSIKEALEKEDPKVLLVEDLCFATTNRQDAVIKGVRIHQADHVIAVGDPTSKNTAMLAVTAANEGVSAQRVNSTDEIDLSSLYGKKRILLTSGASVPEPQLLRVVNWFRSITGNRVEVKFLPEDTPEDKDYALPKDLADIWKKCIAQKNIPDLSLA